MGECFACTLFSETFYIIIVIIIFNHAGLLMGRTELLLKRRVGFGLRLSYVGARSQPEGVR